MPDDFAVRMKTYERLETGRRFMPLLPVYARIDGKNFSKFTRTMARPYEPALTEAMIETLSYLVTEFNARIGYTQSDEINLVWLQDEYIQQLPFDGKIFKMKSVLPSVTTAKFNHLCLREPMLAKRAERMLPAFDCRVFQLPNRAEAANTFLWREQDAAKNAVSMAAQSLFSTRQLHGKSRKAMHEMMVQKGLDFNGLPAAFRRGTFMRRQVTEHALSDAEWERIPAAFRPPRETATRRHTTVVRLDMPIFSTVANREAVIFDGALPITRSADAPV